MPILTVLQNGTIKKIPFDGTALLSDVLNHSDIHVDKPCGGHASCKKCAVLVNGKSELACQYTVSKDAEVVINTKSDIVSAVGASESGIVTENVCLCLDIGTTTLALALVSLDNGQIIKTLTRTNPQTSFGADVISRIEYCSKNGVFELHTSLISKVNEMVNILLDEYKIHSVKNLYTAGNTTMLHLFLGVDCTSIGVNPYVPTFLDMKNVSGETIGLGCVETITVLPGICAFVGADIVCGLGFIPSPKEGKYSLLVDLGTNAEIVLFNKDRYLCTSAAAGPCFEGANISSGMSASVGAICSYRKNGALSVIGNVEPEGICATGLIDIIAELVKSGTVDKSGYMDHEFVLSEDVTVTPSDIREFQLAKSAVLSAIQCLMKKQSVLPTDIDKMYVAGGFSEKLNIENAAFVSLFPSELADKFTPINNSCLLGCAKFACKKNDLEKIAKQAEFIDLGADVAFSELFFKNISF